MAETKIIKNANWVVGWNEDSQQHEYLQDTDVVFKASEITYVGSNYDGDIDQEIEVT